MGAISFTSVKGLRPKLNRFNMSYMKAFPSTMGRLVPIHTDFCIPGTWIELYPSLFTRTNALVRPVIDNISTYCHFWKVPLRLIDKKFTKFIGGEIDPEEYNPAHFTPKDLYSSFNDVLCDHLYLQAFESLPYGSEYYTDYSFTDLLEDEGLFNSSLLDLLGYVGNSSFWQDSDIVLNLYEFKAYLLLLKVWYQNENITINMPCYTAYRGEDYTFEDDTSLSAAIEDFMQLEGNISNELGAFYIDMVGNFGLKATFNHAWAKDYFTSALPNTQYGEEVTIPLATSAPVTGDLLAGQTVVGDPNYLTVGVGGSLTTAQNVNALPEGGTGAGKLVAGGSDRPINTIHGSQTVLKDVTGLEADLSEATSISILELRIAETLQVYKERIMRAGRKYREYLKMFFNVVSSDARLQDPEWLGGGKVALQIGDVEQTSSTNEVTPQGNLAGKGTQFGGNMTKITSWCEEWCIVIGVAYMQPKARYCQGIERNKMKTNDLYDWFNPTFERIGEQPIFTAELFAGHNVSKDDIFGYQRRYAEYTFKNDQMHGAFRNSLSNWTAGLRIFGSKPTLNQQFIYVQPEVFDRIFAVAEAEQDGNVLFWWQHAYYKKQPVSKFGTPGLHLY